MVLDFARSPSAMVETFFGPAALSTLDSSSWTAEQTEMLSIEQVQNTEMSETKGETKKRNREEDESSHRPDCVMYEARVERLSLGNIEVIYSMATERKGNLDTNHEMPPSKAEGHLCSLVVDHSMWFWPANSCRGWAVVKWLRWLSSVQLQYYCRLWVSARW